MDVFTTTESYSEYLNACNRISTMLPEFDMEQFKIHNILSFSVIKVQAKISFSLVKNYN